ncbi:LuxR C-terminal-related transcriptional regulator [Nonomuraea jabiensis]|uniref:LuxR C-terminal-related transcriptional regulator n=1 Tax=Nonomuraea jabiensis TaxID=882448 RepID=UPI00406BB377
MRRVHAGLRVVDPALAAESLTSGASPLTARKRDVLRVARRGGTVSEIARALSLSNGTVRSTCRRTSARWVRPPTRRPLRSPRSGAGYSVGRASGCAGSSGLGRQSGSEEHRNRIVR